MENQRKRLKFLAFRWFSRKKLHFSSDFDAGKLHFSYKNDALKQHFSDRFYFSAFTWCIKSHHLCWPWICHNCWAILWHAPKIRFSVQRASGASSLTVTLSFFSLLVLFSLLIFFLKIPIRILFGCKVIKIMQKTLRIQEYFVNL